MGDRTEEDSVANGAAFLVCAARRTIPHSEPVEKSDGDRGQKNDGFVVFDPGEQRGADQHS